jgi:hypothetical protein
MGEWLPTEKASSANMGGPGLSHPAKVETTAVAGGRTTEQAEPHDVLPPATIAPTIQEAQRPSLSEIAALPMRCGCCSDIYCIAKTKMCTYPGQLIPMGNRRRLLRMFTSSF